MLSSSYKTSRTSSDYNFYSSRPLSHSTFGNYSNRPSYLVRTSPVSSINSNSNYSYILPRYTPTRVTTAATATTPVTTTPNLKYIRNLDTLVGDNTTTNLG